MINWKAEMFSQHFFAGSGFISLYEELTALNKQIKVIAFEMNYCTVKYNFQYQISNLKPGELFGGIFTINLLLM